MEEVTIEFYGNSIDPGRRVYMVDLGACDVEEAHRRINRIRELFHQVLDKDEQNKSSI